MRKRVVYLVILIILFVLGYNYINQDHRNIKNEDAEFIMNSSDLALFFSTNLIESEAKYLNATIEISGQITDISLNSITLDDKVFCQFTTAIENTIDKNLPIKIKGRVIGYDDLLEQVKLDQCSVKKL